MTWSRLTRVNSRTQLADLEMRSVTEVLAAGYTPIWPMIVANTPYSNTVLYQYYSSSSEQSNYLWICILPPPLKCSKACLYFDTLGFDFPYQVNLVGMVPHVNRWEIVRYRGNVCFIFVGMFIFIYPWIIGFWFPLSG